MLKAVGGKNRVKPLQGEMDRAESEKYPGFESVVDGCEKALKQIRERDK